MSTLRIVYLVLAVFGGIYPLILPGAGDVAPFQMVFPNGEEIAINWTNLIAVLTLSIWILAEIYVRKNWHALVALPIAWVIGPGCGLPLYLFLRTSRFS